MVRMDLMEPEAKTRVAPEVAERRYIYNGDTEQPSDRDEFSPVGNRPMKRKRRSILARILLLVAISFLIVFYVWNKITVNRLLVEVNDLQNQYQKIQADNDLLRAEINRKASLERIVTMAGKLGLIYPKQQPVWFEVSADDLERFQQQ